VPAVPRPLPRRTSVLTTYGILQQPDPSVVGLEADFWATTRGVCAGGLIGAPPPTSLLVLCYFLGKLFQVIPLPGGVGPVEGGMVAAFAACGTAVALAVLAVLAYQAISTWLPAAPGVWGYLRLRRRVAAWQAPASARPPARRAA
jgi:uncharacterized membrane protein YbhN (UPF0104 family)